MVRKTEERVKRDEEFVFESIWDAALVSDKERVYEKFHRAQASIKRRSMKALKRSLEKVHR